MVELEDKADVAVSKGDPLRVAKAHQVRAADRHHAAIGPIEPAKNVEQRALADARRADNCHHLPRVNGKVEIAEHGEHGVSHRVRLEDAMRL